MARPLTIPEDPEFLEKILEYLALGLSKSLIARSIGVPDRTFRGWCERKDFSQKLAVKKLELLKVPIQATADRFPKDFIERHPDTREIFAPPKQKSEVDGHLTVTFVGFGGKKSGTL